jgi:hypothetical protein
MTLSASDHFVRYCKPWQFQNNKALKDAFELRQGESDLSGDHYEHYSSNNYEQIINSMKLRCFTPKSNGYLLRLNCGRVKEELLPFCDVCFEKENISNSHTSLIGLDGSANVYAGNLASLVIDFISVGSPSSPSTVISP